MRTVSSQRDRVHDEDRSEGDRPKGAPNPWARHWGMGYDQISKKEFLTPLFNDLEEEDKVGDVVVDIGSGRFPVSEHLRERHRVITVDVVGDESRFIDRMHLVFDVEKAADETCRETREAVSKAAQFLEIDCSKERTQEHVDTMVLSEILNYVDYQAVISALKRYLKPGGRVIIVDMPGRGIKNLFSSKGLSGNAELLAFLEQEGFKVERKLLPWNTKHFPPTNTDLMVVVARKS